MKLRNSALCILVLSLTACFAQKSETDNKPSIEQTKENNKAVFSSQTRQNSAGFPLADETIQKILKTISKNLKVTGAVKNLSEEPAEIQNIIMDFIDSEADKKLAEVVKIIEAEQDLNNDGKPEKLIIPLTYANNTEIPTKYFHIFSEMQGRWKSLTEGLLLEGVEGISFVKSEKANKFAVMKSTAPLRDEETGTSEIFFRLQKGKYIPYKCLEIINGKAKKVSCNF